MAGNCKVSLLTVKSMSILAWTQQTLDLKTIFGPPLDKLDNLQL
jgi:hypothetical protein